MTGFLDGTGITPVTDETRELRLRHLEASARLTRRAVYQAREEIITPEAALTEILGIALNALGDGGRS